MPGTQVKDSSLRNLRVTFIQEGEEKEVEGDQVLVATGRVPQVENLE